jgi:hypothetical protein
MVSYLRSGAKPVAPVACRLDHAGAWADDWGVGRRLGSATGLSSQARRDARQWLPSFDIYADTSTSDGIFVVILEAMAAAPGRWASAPAPGAPYDSFARERIERHPTVDEMPGDHARLYRKAISQGGM